jgi:hypothetical protein
MEGEFNPTWFFLFEIWESFKLFWPVFLLVGVISILIFLWSRAEAKAEAPSFLLLSSFSLLGATIGILTGWSRSPVVGTTISAFMGLIAGLSIYLIGRKEYPRTVVSSCVIILSFFLIVGTYLGGKLRGIEIESDRKYEEWLLDYKRNLQDKSTKYTSQLEVWKKEGIEGIQKRNKSQGVKK